LVGFGDAVAETGMVSNAAYRLKLQDGTMSSAPISRSDSEDSLQLVDVL
jgi:hypothetical protein